LGDVTAHAEPQEEPGMFDFFWNFPWFLKVHRYDAPEQLLTAAAFIAQVRKNTRDLESH
jgi:hypothetical protein